jgi:translation initiation factor IF-2
VAKRRVYDIAKERGLTNQELVERLRAAGVEVKAATSSVEQADVDRALSSKSAATAVVPGEPAPKRAVAEPTRDTVTKPAAAKVEQASPSEATSATPPATTEAKTAPVAEATSVSAPASAGADRRPPAQPRPARPEGQRPVQGAPEGARGEARPEGPRPEGARPPARKPMRPRGRGPRLEDLPTVVGPGVPLRKGVKPSGTVVTKEELARMKAEKAAKAEEARKAAAAAPPRPADADASAAAPARGQAPARGPVPSRGPAPRPFSSGPRPPRPVAAPAAAPARRDRGGRAPEHERPAGWEEPVEPAGPAAAPGAPRVGAPSRVRRGDDKPAKRRVIIDSQAGRKGGKGGFRDHRGGVVGDAERPIAKKKTPPGIESPAKIKSGASVKDLSEALELGAGELIKTLMRLGEMATITQSLADDAILILAEEFERKVEIQHAEEEKEGEDVFADDPADLTPRAPVVTIMGHVDHGKTSLLDAIRETEVVKSEAGGITQHIGAYQVTHNEKKVTFLDTPGHEAFTAMRARGAKSTDIAVIVVAANDGVMPQTLEAISHAKAAEVPIVVAINKMDLADANPDHVKHQLSDQGLVPEAWGGETVMVEVSAKKRVNLEELMDMILLVAEVQELKANAKAPATGVVIEAQLDVGRGPVATLLVQRGTLRVGDAITSGESYGKVKAMFDFTGKALTKAGPSVPVQILGFNSLPMAGDFAMVVKDEREARQRSEQRTARLRQEQLAKSRGGASSLEEFYRRVKEGRVKELPLVIKGDVGGSVEALEEALLNITHPEVKVAVVFAGVGGINESDIMLASASKAVVIGFNVRPSVAAKALAEQEQVDVRTYRVIYKAIEDVEAALMGMLEPEQVEEDLGMAEVRQVFRASRIGTIAGCYVQNGKLIRSAKIRLLRNGSIVYEGTIGSLKRFSDDVREVLSGYECGIHIDGFDDIHEGDIIEAYEIKEVARTQ